MYYIIDGNNFAFRAFHSEYKSVKNINDEEISIVQSFLNMIKFFISNLNDIEELIICWDCEEPTQKKQYYSEYKSQRSTGELKDVLVQQIGVLKRHMNLFGVKQLYHPGIEADDIIFVIVKILNNINKECAVVSADKDLLQLVGPRCRVINLNKKITVKTSNFEDVTGVPVESFIDFLAMIGDRSDNIDGVSGIGPETAKKIIQNYSNCQNIYDSEEEIKTLISIKQIDNSFSKRIVSMFEEKNREKVSRNIKLVTLGSLLERDTILDIVREYEQQKDLKINVNGVKDFINKMHLYDISKNIDVFLLPFMRIISNKQ